MATGLQALRHARFVLALLAFSLAAGARAEDTPRPEQQPAAAPSGQKAGGRGTTANPPAAEQHRLPPDSTTKQTLALPGRTLNFTAVAGSIHLFDDKGEPQADIVYTAYQLDGADPRTRPVTFIFNGGPGAASAWLQFGNTGPWRLAINADAVTSSASPDLLPNAETWLDFTDLVCELQTQQGVGVKGLILVSPVLDFREYSGSSILQYVASLPTMAAVARETKGPVTRTDLAEVENYARGDFLGDLVKGEADTEATTRLADRVAALTGIDQSVSRRLAGRFEVGEFRREFDRRDGKVTGRYDASVLGFDPYPDSSFYHFGDPSGDPLFAPLTSAAVDLTTRKLNWRPDGSYQLLNGAVEKAWDFGRGLHPTESMSQLRQVLALDPKLKLLVAHGLFDLATPYFGTKIQLDQLPAYASPERVKLVVYPGGHMFYSRDASRQAFRAEAQALMK